MKERGYVIIGAVVFIMLAMALGFGTVLILEHSNLLAAGKNVQERLVKRSHEIHSVSAERNSDNTVVAVKNTGSVNSVVTIAMVEETDNSLTVYDIDPVTVGVRDTSTFVLSDRVDENAIVGIITRLGNVFWEN